MADVIGYGGSAGGGKSDALLMAGIIACLSFPGCNVGYFRREYPQLEGPGGAIMRSHELITGLARWNGSLRRWTFPNGSVLQFCHAKDEKDVYNYQSQQFDLILIDEATQFTRFQYRYLRTRNRATVPGVKPFTALATNPGNVGHCVPYGEVLTPNGWVDISKLKVGDPVYAVSKDGKIVVSEVGQVHRHYFEGDLWKAKTRNLTIICTPEHRVAKMGGTREDPGALFSLVPVKDLPGQSYILRSADYDGEEIKEFTVEEYNGAKKINKQPRTISGDDYVELMGWFLTEGSVIDRDRAFVISQMKPENRHKIASLLNRCGFKFVEDKSGFIVYSADWWNYFRQFGKCREKFVPRQILNASKRQLKIFLEAAMDGDGHWIKRGESGHFYTYSKQLADDICEVAVKLGKKVYVSSRKKENRHGLEYVVNISCGIFSEVLTGQHRYNVTTKMNKKPHVERVPFRGVVYDIGVPEHHTFIIRQDGSVWVSGNSWFKEEFVTIGPPEVPHRVEVEGGEEVHIFIPARLDDNQALLERDPEYRKRLEAQPEIIRRQLLEGDWDIADGIAFPEFRRDLHVIEPFEIPDDWIRFRALDWGYSRPYCVGWYAIDYDGRLYKYRELYGWGGQPDVGTKEDPEEVARKILELEQGEKIRYGVADDAIFGAKQDNSPSIAEQFARAGVIWMPVGKGPRSRIQGKLELHHRLKPREGELPMLVFFNTCVHTIRTLPSLVLDPRNPEDVDTNQEDHCYDETRYAAMSRPLATPKPKEPETVIQRHKRKLMQSRMRRIL